MDVFNHPDAAQTAQKKQKRAHGRWVLFFPQNGDWSMGGWVDLSVGVRLCSFRNKVDRWVDGWTMFGMKVCCMSKGWLIGGWTFV